MFNATVSGLLNDRNDCAESYRNITEVPLELKSFVELSSDEITMTLRKDEKMPITLQLALTGNNRFSFRIERDGRCKNHEWRFSYLNDSCGFRWRWNSENDEEYFTFEEEQIAVKEQKVNIIIDGDVTLESGNESKSLHNVCAARLPISCEDNRKFYDIYIKNEPASTDCDISLKFNRAGFKLRKYETTPTISTSLKPTEESTLIWPYILAGSILLILLFIAIFIVVCCVRKRKRRRPDEEKAQEKQTPKTEKSHDIKKPHIQHVFIQEDREKSEGRKQGTSKQRSEVESPVELSAPIPVVELPISDHKEESKNKKRHEKRSAESFPVAFEKEQNASDKQKRSNSSFSKRSNVGKQPSSITTKKVHVTKSEQTEYDDDRVHPEQVPSRSKSSKSAMMSAILSSKDNSKRNDANLTSSQKARVPMASGSLSTKTAKRGDNQREYGI